MSEKRPSLNGRAPQTKPQVSPESPGDVLDMLTKRWAQLEKVLKSQLKTTPDSVHVTICGDDLYSELLGMFMQKGSWRLCHATCEFDANFAENQIGNVQAI